MNAIMIFRYDMMINPRHHIANGQQLHQPEHMLQDYSQTQSLQHLFHAFGLWELISADPLQRQRASMCNTNDNLDFDSNLVKDSESQLTIAVVYCLLLFIHCVFCGWAGTILCLGRQMYRPLNAILWNEDNDSIGSHLQP